MSRNLIPTGSSKRDDSHTDDASDGARWPHWRRRALLRAVGAASAGGLTVPLSSSRVRAGHETDPCAVTIDFNRANVVRVFAVVAAGLTSLTVYYFDRDGTAQSQAGIDPTTNADYGEAPLRVRYDADEDKTTIQIGGEDAAIRRVVAFGPDCRSAMTNPLDSAAGDNDEPTADFIWTPDPGFVGEPVAFTSSASDPDGELIHYGWDFDGDGEADATGADVTHTFTSAGDHAVTHTVIDDFDATDSTTLPVSVRLPWEQTAKLVASDGSEGDLFGISVAVDDDEGTAIVGAFEDDDPNGNDAGSAYVFTRNGGAWGQQQKLTAADGDNNDKFGRSVAVDGDTAFIGAHVASNTNGVAAGSVYVFVRSGETWSQQQKLTAADGDDSDHFGSSVAVDGDTALVGARFDEDPNGVGAGSAYVFTRIDGAWSQQQKLVAADGDSNDGFGDSVAVDGDTALVGAPGDEDPNGVGAGSAYVFTRNGGAWGQQQKLTAADGDADDLFGSVVSLNGDTAIVGAASDEDPNGDFAGAAYVFVRSGETWRQQQKLTAADGDIVDFFGSSVAVDGDTAFVGASDDEDPNGRMAGSTYVFTRSGSTWSQQRKLTPDDGDSGDGFGSSVAVAGDIALVGGPGDEDPNGVGAGSAYVFKK